MIQKLLLTIIDRLQKNLAQEVAPRGKPIKIGAFATPDKGELPAIGVYPGKLAISQKLGEPGPSHPYQEEIAVARTRSSGPYPLARTPLAGSVRCRIAIDRGGRNERALPLVEDRDFTLDYQQRTLSLRKDLDLPKGSTILLAYSSAGIFVVKEFHQEFTVAVYAAEMAQAEQWAALAMSIILTTHDNLIEQYNFKDKTEYAAGAFSTSHTLNQIQMIEGTPTLAADVSGLQLTFQATGQLELAREIDGGLALIKKIRSPGRESEHAVDIDIGVDPP